MPTAPAIHRASISGAFSLIEVMIAITLGMLLVYAAMAGFRVASQTITSANRLATENSLLRAGFHEALNEIDLWTAYDDPESTVAGDQALRRPQMPFQQMPTTPLLIPATALNGWTYSEAETDLGWNHQYPWPASSPRTWWRANGGEWHNSNKRHGKYNLFAAIGSSPHPWLFTQMEMLHTNLGYYAFCDYLPASMPYTYIDSTGDMSPMFTNAGTAFRNGDGGASFAQGRYRCTKDTSYPIVPLEPLGGTGMITTSNVRTKFNTGVGANVNSVRDLMNRSLSTRKQLDQKPPHWPEVKVEVARFICHNRFVSLSKIGFTNTLTGQQIELSFNAIGTTLRGARQMRKPGAPGSGAGWARWWGPNETDNDRHLDYNP